MPLRTRFTELVGVEHPVLCGGMQYVGYAEMAAAVSNAGGLGTVSALTQGTAEKLRAEIQKCRSLTSRPFCVNFTILPAMVTPEYHIIVKAALDEGVRIVQTAGRSPESVSMPDGRTLIQVFKEAGCIVIHKCMSVRHAITAERVGVDCVSLGGFEYGGHCGEDDVTHWVLQPTAALKLKVPHLVAGATSVGPQLAAALAMGASGVELGTAFMATRECPIQDGIKNAILGADERSTQLILRSVKNTGRFYKNHLTKKVAETEAKQPGDFKPIAQFMTGKRVYNSLHKSGDPDDSCWTCGMAAGMITDIPTCKEFLDRLVSSAEAVIQERLPVLVAPSKL